jgi:hypothetical protein
MTFKVLMLVRWMVAANGRADAYSKPRAACHAKDELGGGGGLAVKRPEM